MTPPDRLPEDDALDRLRLYALKASPEDAPGKEIDEALATVRSALERFRAERDALGLLASQRRDEVRGALAEGLRRYPTWGHAYIAEKQRADRLATVVKDAWGSLLAYYTDISETEVQRLIASCESVNDLLGGAK